MCRAELATSIERVSACVHVDCLDCGYDLRTLPADSVCPECGKAVAESFRPDSLLQLPMNELSRFRSLLLWPPLCIAGLLLSPAFTYGVLSATGWWHLEWLAARVFFVLVAGTFGGLIAAWSALCRGPWRALEKTDEAPTWESGLRTILLFLPLLWLLPFLAWASHLEITPELPDAVIAGALMILPVALVTTLGGAIVQPMLMADWARRLNNRALLARAHRLVWAAPGLLTLGLCVYGLGVVIWIYLSCRMLGILRREVGRVIAARAAAGGAV